MNNLNIYYLLLYTLYRYTYIMCIYTARRSVRVCVCVWGTVHDIYCDGYQGWYMACLYVCRMRVGKNDVMCFFM